MKLPKIKLTKPIVILSAAGSLIGGSILVKDMIGGVKYEEDVSARGKIVVVTGANSGIGKATARELARRKAKVIMACRDLEKCEKARREIIVESKNKYVVCKKCDLASQESIRAFAEQVKKENKKIHVLINNAGISGCRKMLTQELIEMQLGVNHMGHFLLTMLLLDKLKDSAPSRVVNVSSVAHKRGTINKEDLNSEKSYDRSQAYNQSKLANVLFTRELAKRLEGSGVTTNAVHPGIVNTDILRHSSFYDSWLSTVVLKPILWLFIKSPHQGAQTSVYAALDPTLEGVSGKYFAECREAEMSPEAKDDVLARWLWLVSEKWTNSTIPNSIVTK
uniref:NADP-retinol dehydrogenase n=1 Tax=Cacopsylla melanoneura TaxID=428564 RepID=A0A8D8ZY76_9HEMI